MRQKKWKKWKKTQRNTVKKARTSCTNTKCHIDVWLERLSQVSHLGLFVITMLTIYFTVIPLYEKALLDEEIARKEIVLGELKKELVAYHIKNRASIVQDLVRWAQIECSGVGIKMSLTLGEAINQSKDKVESYTGNLSIKPEECLAEIINTERLSELKPQEVLILKKEINHIGTTLEGLRVVAFEKYITAEQTVKKNASLMLEGPLTGFFVDFYIDSLSIEEIQQIKFDRAVSDIQFDLEQQYQNEVLSHVSSLRDISFPSISEVDI